MSKANTPKQVLIAAKWILENVGWCQGTYCKTKSGEPALLKKVRQTGDVGYACMVGSIYLVESNEHLHNQAIAVVRETLKDMDVPDNIIFAIGAWNDDPKRTKKQVLKLLDKCIAKAE